MTRLERVTLATECCSSAVRCNECPYNMYATNNRGIHRLDCQRELMLEFLAETGIEGDTAWWYEGESEP